MHSITFNRDGSRLATVCRDKRIRSIDPRSGLVVSVSKCIITINRKIPIKTIIYLII